MPKKIIELVEERRAKLATSSSEAERTGLLAVAAINGGIRSLGWRNYMLPFGEITPVEPGQLERLLATDGSLGEADLDMRRAYLVANGVCGAASPNTDGLIRNV